MLAAIVLGGRSIGAPAGDKEPMVRGKPVSEWIDLLQKSPRAGERQGAAVALGQAWPNKANIAALGDALDDKDGNVRLAAAAALKNHGPAAAAATPRLLARLKDTEEKAVVRGVIAGALAVIAPADKGAIAALTEALEDKQLLVRGHAALALHTIDPKNDKKVVEVLLKVVQTSKDDDARTQAIHALGTVGPEARPAVPALLKALAEGGMVGQAARKALLIIDNDALRKFDDK
jgi:HEAT repeat protein